MATMVIAPGGYPHEDRFPGQDGDAPTNPLTGLAGQVRNEQIKALLTGRPPDLLDDPDQADLLRDIKRGVAAEVTQLIGLADGDTLPPGLLLDLATWAVALGTASNIEDSLFPEQQLGDDARAQRLQVRYLGVREQLHTLADSGAPGTGPGVSSAPQAGGFDPPQTWPESAAPMWPAAAWTGYPGAGW